MLDRLMCKYSIAFLQYALDNNKIHKVNEEKNTLIVEFEKEADENGDTGISVININQLSTEMLGNLVVLLGGAFIDSGIIQDNAKSEEKNEIH
jgi:hypothetical protein